MEWFPLVAAAFFHRQNQRFAPFSLCCPQEAEIILKQLQR